MQTSAVGLQCTRLLLIVVLCRCLLSPRYQQHIPICLPVSLLGALHKASLHSTGTVWEPEALLHPCVSMYKTANDASLRSL